MEEHEFRGVVTPSGILSAEEVSLLQKYFEATLDGTIGFPEHHRLPNDLVRRERFRFCRGRHSYRHGLKDALVFEVIYPIELHGVVLFGDYNCNYYMASSASGQYAVNSVF